MLNFIDNALNRITMYRLVLYYLIFLLVIAGIFGFFGILPYSPLALLFSTFVLLATAMLVNELFGRVFEAQRNVESAYITALILALIITPILPTEPSGVLFLIWAGAWAMASKYILAIGKKHIFNPAAFAVALTAFTISRSASWWVGGNLPLMLFVVLGGLVITRKIQRFDLALSFLAASTLSTLILALSNNPLSTIQKLVLHTPLFFFAFVMLAEPLTTPPTRVLRIIYGTLVGLLFAPQVHLGSVYSTPELALLAGNIFSYLVSPKGKLALKFGNKTRLAPDTYEFAFANEKQLRFHPGQYLEWTLAHKPSDSRGNRRYFTIASSPTEPTISLGVKFYPEPSTFKRSLFNMQPGEEIVATQLAGDFVLPRDKEKKLVFVAGGIGITPFRSMLKYLADHGEERPITLFYSVRTAEEAAYSDFLNVVSPQLGVKIIYLVTDEPQLPAGWYGYNARLNAEMIRREVPDYGMRTFYVSGPRSLVVAAEKVLAEIGVPRTHVKTDFFPGFA